MKKKNPIVKKSKKYIPIRFIQKRKKFSSFFFSFTSVNLIWFIYLFIYFWVEWWWRGKESRDLFECVWNQTNKYVCVYTHQSKFLAFSSPILLVFFFVFFSSLEFTIFLRGVLSFYYSHLRIWIAADYYFLWKEILSTVDSFREEWIPVVQVLYYLLFYLDVRLP
jgi:hypothetical protein